jgi:3-dehydroquinate synthase
MDTIRVNLEKRTYDICVGAGLLPQLGSLIAPLGLGRRLGLVTHPALAELYAPAVEDSLRRAGHDVALLSVPSGESSKALDRVCALAREMVQAGLDRGSAVLALGGGVVGDLAGFVAAILFRGIPFVSLPTTLLAQVDSSVGGKTGVNLPEGKNLVGAFHQPRLVVADVATLQTLSEREFRSGLAEVVKHAMIADAGLFRLLEEAADAIQRREPDVLRIVVARNCAIKAAVVEEDEREGGRRAILNFGHTVGHALEAALTYGSVTHGEAVARGMLTAAELSVQRGLCPRPDADRLAALLTRLGLLTAAAPSFESLEKYLLTDKKRRSGTLQIVLTHGVGSATLAPLFGLEELQAALRAAS